MATNQDFINYWNQSGGFPANPYPTSTYSDAFEGNANTSTQQLGNTQVNSQFNPVNALGTTNQTASGANDPISGLYTSLLGRAPDAAGLQYWNQQLQSGKSLSDIANAFKATPEYQQRTQSGGITPNPSTQANTNPYGISTGNQFAGSTNPYIQATQQTALGNLAGAQTATAANRVNQSTPYANLNYVQTGTDAQGNPIWTAKQSLSGPLAGAQSSLAQGVANQAAQGFNPNTPSVGINPGQTYSDAIMQRLQPQQAHAAEMQAQSLANQGIMPGSDAYNNAMRTFQQGQNDQLTSAITGGIGVGLQANQQSFNQQLQQANLPIQQLGAFQQATQPGYVSPYTQAATSGPDYTGAYATSQAAALAAQNAANAKTANMQNGLYTLGGAALSGGGLATLGNAASGAYNWLSGLGGNSFGNSGLTSGVTNGGVTGNVYDAYGNLTSSGNAAPAAADWASSFGGTTGLGG